jgi:FKBP-type peptidyl-prolyl cis-trans isomerase (trigger factor)
VRHEIAHRIGRMQQGMSRQGVDPASIPWDYERLSTELRPSAVRAVRWALLQEVIAEKEELASTDADVEAEIARLARETGRPPQAVRGILQKSGDLERLGLTLRERKVLNLLTESAVIEPEA